MNVPTAAATASPKPTGGPPAAGRGPEFAGGSRASTADFTFRVDGVAPDTLLVSGFAGSEALSELFHFRVGLCSSEDDLDLQALLGQRCCLRIDAAGRTRRHVHGIVQRCERIGRRTDRTDYAVEVTPAHWMLTRRHQSRIFQEHNCGDMTVPGVVRKVLEDAGMPEDSFRFALQEDYPVRDYIVQYRESDFAFISRLMEEEGIFYFFEHETDGHCMVMADGPVALVPDPGAPEAVFRDPSGLVAEAEHVSSLLDRREIRTGAVSLDDYDFQRPPVDLAAGETAEQFASLEYSDCPGGYTEHPVGQRYARIRLEEQQCARRVLHLRATVRALKPGDRFTLRDHPDAGLNREYVVTQASSRARQSQAGEEDVLAAPEDPFEVELTVIPGDTSYRPPRATARPTIHSSQTAIVTGPQQEEVYTDAYGRVKVQFHWDRHGRYDEHSSCWIRVSQAWAGGNYGAIFLPRVGQEVLVTFLEGRPDHPIITGRVYNNDHMPPFKLPDRKTVGGIRSRSSKGGGGANEIRFDDTKDKEELFLHAARDLHVRARNDRFETIERGRHTTVQGHDYDCVGKSRHSHVKLDLNQQVDGSLSLKVAGDVGEEFDGNHSRKIVHNHYVSANKGVVIEAGTELTLKVGGNFVKIDKAGVTILGKMVDINSGGSAGTGSPIKLKAPKEPGVANETEIGRDTRYGQDPTEMAALDPAEGEQAGEPEQRETDTSWIEIELVDDAGQPCPHEAYKLRKPDGEVYAGSLDENGFAHVALPDPGGCEVCFPNLDAAAWERL